MSKIGDTGIDLISMGLGFGAGILNGVLFGMVYFVGVNKNSGEATGIGMAVGVGTCLLVGCATWIWLKRSDN